MEAYLVLKDLAIIIIFAKLFGLIARKCKAPQVVGEILAGLLIGPSVLGLVVQSEFLTEMAEIGVILLMFSAGLETDLKDMKKTGFVAFLVALAGVFVSLVGGTLYYMAFYGPGEIGSDEFFRAVFIGVIMTATSVSITVQTLKELGKIKSKIGTTIISAAIIDDVIGIVVLTFVIGFKQPGTDVIKVILNVVLFFAFVIVVGYIVYRIFKFVDDRYPKTRRIPIASLAFCFSMAYIAEKYFGIADITGAYVAGIILCSMRDSDYIDEKMSINSYMLFGPVFFASIGLKTNIDNINGEILLFSIGFVIVAILCKVIGCGLVGKLCKHNLNDSLKIGVGMMTRGEVALIISQKGLSVGLLEPVYFTSVIMLIIVSSISTPILMKLFYAKEESMNKRDHEAFLYKKEREND